MICSVYVKTLTLTFILTIQLHTIVLPTSIQITANKFFVWFSNNHMKENPEKSHLLWSSKNLEKSYFGEALIESSSTEKLFGIQIDSDLTLDEHFSSICNKARKKINVLRHLVNYMSFDKRRMVMKAFIESHFNYCPLTWMFHSRALDNKFNCLHERSLIIVQIIVLWASRKR